MAVNGPYCRDVLCPFYKGGHAVAINCEGPFYSCLRVQMLFDSKSAMLIHLRTFCTKEYKKCEIYNMIYQAKYNDE